MSLVIAMEPWGSAADEGIPLGVAHFEEVEHGVEPNRPFKVDQRQMQFMSRHGILKVFTARLDGAMVGYLTWTVLSDAESEGLIIAKMGPWFVQEGAPRKTAALLWDRSEMELKSIGVKMLFPHHRLQGRGAQLGKFFARKGAMPISMEYSLWIGDGPHG